MRGGSVFAEDADIGEVAVVFVGVHAVADKEFGGGAEAEPVGFHALLFGREVLVDQDAGAAGERAFRQDFFSDLGEREPGVQNVVDEQNVASLQVKFQLAAHRELAGGRVMQIGSDRQGVHADGHINLAQEVGGEEQPAVHHDDGGQFVPGIRAGNIGGKLGNAAAENVGIVQGFEGDGHGGGQAPFPAAFFSVPVVE